MIKKNTTFVIQSEWEKQFNDMGENYTHLPSLYEARRVQKIVDTYNKNHHPQDVIRTRIIKRITTVLDEVVP